MMPPTTTTSAPYPGVRRATLTLAGLLGALAACGQVGPPLPPLRLRPEPPAELQIVQHGPQLLIRCRAPRASVDGVRLPVLDVDLTWLAGDGDLKTAGTHVLRRVAPGELLVEPLDTVPPSGTRLRATALARNGKHVSASTPTVTHTIEAAPSAPTGVVAERTASGVQVRWADGVARVRVYRRGEGETASQPLATEPTPTGTTSYDDASPGAALAACYTVRAVSATSPVVESLDSAETCVVAPQATPLEVPVGLAIVADGDTVVLSWSPSGDPRVQRYRVYRAIGGDPPEALGETDGASTTHRDTEPPKGERLVYTVTAVASDNAESAASAPAITRVRIQQP